MNIGLDFDGVVADCGELKRLAAWEMYGVSIATKNLNREYIVEQQILTAEQYRAVQTAVYTEPQYSRRQCPVWGAPKHIKLLHDHGHHIQIITNRDGESLALAERWLYNMGLGWVPIRGVGYGASKLEAAFGLAAFVDDDLDKLSELRGSVPNLYLFSQPYNDRDSLYGIKRISSWSALYTHLMVNLK